MGESLWHELDAWQVAKIRDAMGQNSSYETLRLQKVDTALVWDYREWSSWPKPAVAVISYAAERDPGPHGNGEAEFTKYYPTVWLALTEGKQADAIRDTKILLARLEMLIQDLYAELDLPASDDGERLVNLHVARSELSAHRPPTSNDDYWMVMGGIALRWESET